MSQCYLETMTAHWTTCPQGHLHHIRIQFDYEEMQRSPARTTAQQARLTVLERDTVTDARHSTSFNEFITAPTMRRAHLLVDSMENPE